MTKQELQHRILALILWRRIYSLDSDTVCTIAEDLLTAQKLADTLAESLWKQEETTA